MQTAETVQTADPTLLPSIYQFYSASVSNYTQVCLTRIQGHIRASSSERTQAEQVSVEQLKYHKLSNQELRRRGDYLYIVYELANVLTAIPQQMNERLYEQLVRNHGYATLSGWLQKNRLSKDQLAKLNSLKQNLCADSSLDSFNRRLIVLLFETELFVQQILMRLLTVKGIHDEHKKMQRVAPTFEFYFLSQAQSEGKQASATFERPMRVSLVKRCKQLFKEVDQLVTFYQLEISMNRPDCRIKPELQGLIALLQHKFSPDLLSQVFKKTQLGPLSLAIKQNLKANLFSPFILVQLPSARSAQPQLRQATQEIGAINYQLADKESANELFLEISSEEISIQVEVRPKCQLQPQYLPEYQQCQQKCVESESMPKKQLERTAQTAKDAKPWSQHTEISKGRHQHSDKSKGRHQHSERSKSKQENKDVVASYLKKKGYKGSTTSKLCNYSQYKKLQFISKNQRFGSRCNLQKRLVKHKRQRSESEEHQQEQRRQYNFKVREYPNGQVRVFDQQDLLILADETDERKLTRLHKSTD